MNYAVHANPTEIYCNIVKSDDKRHQLIYASQLYGTFFAVSAQLKLSDNNNDSNTELLSMDIHLINYKGLLNIGLLPETKKAWSVDASGAALLVLHLSALSGIHGHDNKMTVDCTSTKIASLKDLVVTRKLIPMRNTSMLNQLESNTFDSEFYVRDGSIIADNDRTDDVNLMVTIDGRCRDTRSKFI